VNAVLTAYDLNQQMMAKSREVDEALVEYRRAADQWATAEHTSKRSQAQAYLTAKAKTVGEREALVFIQCEAEILSASTFDALRNGAKEALRARLAQLSALQSQATALREEIRLARTDNYS
jgi:hypothetical protein